MSAPRLARWVRHSRWPWHCRWPWHYVRAAAATAWRALRIWSGDAAYEAYLSRASDGPALSRQAFYLDMLQRRYSRPNRCC